MNMTTVTLPSDVVESLYRQAKSELDMFTKVGITIDQVTRNARTFYIYGEYLPAIMDACKPDELKHYLVMSTYVPGTWFACTRGEQGKADVLDENPGVTFVEVDKDRCPNCLAYYLPEIAAETTRFVPPCTCYLITIVENVHYIVGGEDDCPVHGFGPDDENVTTEVLDDERKETL